jgi:hypothetical protein
LPNGRSNIISNPGPQSTEAGSPMSADETALTGTSLVSVKLSRKTREPTFKPHPWPETEDAREGRCQSTN